jgi:hypothetical protein
MNRLGWLSLAVAGWGLTLGTAQGEDRATSMPRGSASTRLIPPRPSEVTIKTSAEQGPPPAGLTPVEGVPVASGDPNCQECSNAPFWDTMSGIKSWCGHRLGLPTLRFWAGADEGFLPGDVEDPYWFRFEYLSSWFHGYSVPAMLTTSNPQTSRGILGNEGTTVLFGGDLDLQQHQGGRFTFGFWVEPSHSWGFETRYFFLADRHAGVKFASRGAPLLAAPFFNALTDEQDAVPIANLAITDLNARSGFADVYANSRLQGLELSSAHNYFRGPRGRVDLLWGYRYLRLDEGINNNIATFIPAAGGTTGTLFLIYDQFGTENSFHGINGCLRSQWWWGCWSLDINTQIAIGATRASSHVFGQTTSVSPTGVVNTQVGGIYALPNNSGDTTHVRFSTASEFDIGLGYQWFDHVRLTLGYNVLYWTGVVRPGDLIDTRINPNQFPPVTSGGPLLPEKRFSNTNFWANSLTLGLELRY